MERVLERVDFLLRVLHAEDRPVVVDADEDFPAGRIGEGDHFAGDPLRLGDPVLELEVGPLAHRGEPLDVVVRHRIGPVERGGGVPG